MRTDKLAPSALFAAFALIAGCGGAEQPQGDTTGGGAQGGGDSGTAPTGGGGTGPGGQGGSGGAGGSDGPGGAGGSTTTGTGTDTGTGTSTGPGAAQSCAPLWSRVFPGDIGQQFVTSMVPDDKGDLVVGGYFDGTMDTGGGDVTSDDSDLFLVKLDKDGNHVWTRTLGGPLNQYGQMIPDGKGGIVVTGQMEGSLDLGAGPLVSEGGYDAFVARFDAEGKLLWNKRFGGAGFQSAVQARVDPKGDLVLTGRFQEAIDLGGGALQSAGDFDVWVAKFDIDGNHVWSKSFGDGYQELAVGIQTDSAGNVLFTGMFVGGVDLGGGLLESQGAFDVFVAKLDPQGKHLWSRRFGDSQMQTVAALALGPSDSVFVTGTFSGTVDFGAGPLASQPGLLGDVFVIQLDAGGKLVQGRAFGGEGQRMPYSIAVDADGSQVVTGQFSGTMDAGGGPLKTTSQADYDAFVVKLDPAGNHLYSARFGDDKMQTGEAVAMASPGQPVVAGAFDGTVDFGDGPHTDGPSMKPVEFDLFVTRFECKAAR